MRLSRCCATAAFEKRGPTPRRWTRRRADCRRYQSLAPARSHVEAAAVDARVTAVDAADDLAPDLRTSRHCERRPVVIAELHCGSTRRFRAVRTQQGGLFASWTQ